MAKKNRKAKRTNDVAEAEVSLLTTNKVICLHCGTECDGNFCPNCGQSTKTERIRKMSSFKKSASEIFRFNGPYFNTLKDIILHPASMVERYIHGHRICYTAPFVFLITSVIYLSFAAIIIPSLFGDGTQRFEIETHLDMGEQVPIAVTKCLEWILNNKIIITLLSAVPCILSALVVYRKQQARRFNLAEYIVVAVYINAASLLLRIVDIPFVLFTSVSSNYIANMYIIFATFMIAYKAFPMATFKQALFKYILWGALSFVIFIICISVPILITVAINPDIFMK